MRNNLEMSIALYMKSRKIDYEYEEHTFTLMEGYRYANRAVRPITYTPDFVFAYPIDVTPLYTRRVVLEVKGYAREDYILKRKMFIQQHILTTEDRVFAEVKSVYQLEAFLKFLDTQREEFVCGAKDFRRTEDFQKIINYASH